MTSLPKFERLQRLDETEVKAQILLNRNSFEASAAEGTQILSKFAKPGEIYGSYEQLWYRYATFVDTMQSKTKERMKAEKEKNEKYLEDINKFMKQCFRAIPRQQFYAGFSQLLSRITHPSESVWEVLKGLSDRHTENILLDLTCGDVFHVDFNLLFNKGEELNVPEIVPFRLTHNMLDEFGPLGVEGSFRKGCEVSLSVLRNKQKMLLTVLQTFLHDPLVEWTKPLKAQQQTVVALRGSSVDPVSKAKEVYDYIEQRLIGHIVTPKYYQKPQNAFRDSFS